MNPELKAKWLNALRSGEYQQARATLRNRVGRMCCLGVLCDIQGVDWKTLGPTARHSILQPVHRTEIFAAGLSADQQHFLAETNDAGTPFLEIADWIEKNL